MENKNSLPEGHPRGALILMLLYAAFVVAAWLYIYFGIYLTKV